jgi:glycerol-3-phosphate acyltransferase PlsX
MSQITVALDAMGGDNSPDSVISGASLYLTKYKTHDVKFKIFGDQNIIEKLIKLKSNEILNQSSELIHTDEIVLPNEKASNAIRRKKNSSMYKAIQDVREGYSNCVVSAGNTGAYMAISKLLLGMLQNIHRPAIVTTLPSKKKEVVVLDLGANLDCNSDILCQFAYMGVAFCRSVFKRENPSVALLNIGSEENKGTDTIKETYHLLKDGENDMNFIGYVEPNEMLEGIADVVVTDGFSGNIMLKTAESMYYLIKENVDSAIKSSIIGMICGFFLKKSIKKSMNRFNPKLRNGAMLIGLNGISVKAHGSSDAIAFANAIDVAVNLTYNNVNSQITSYIDNIIDENI